MCKYDVLGSWVGKNFSRLIYTTNSYQTFHVSQTKMASPTTEPKTVTTEISLEWGTLIRVFSDGTLERPLQTPFVSPTLNDLETGLSSKDILIQHNPKISARLYLPKITNESQKIPILVYFHGGAFIFGSAFCTIYDQYCKTLVTQSNVLVVSVEYGLAPENPLPACYNHSWAALKWVCSHHSNEKPNNIEPWLLNHGDFSQVFIGGDSAGANIAHNVAIRIGNEPEALPSDVKILGAILIHPYFQSSDPIGSEPIIDSKNNLPHAVWHYVYPNAPGGIDNPMINPLGPDAPSLDKLGCSRIIVCVAGIDKLRDRGVWYYEALKKSGWKGKLELFEEEGEDHVYPLLKPELESSKKFIKRLVSFLQEE